MYGKTIRQIPQEIKTEGHALLLKGGYIRSLGSGLVSVLPLGFRVIKKIEAIIRGEMERLGGQEVLTPLVNPLDIWKKTGRSDLIDRSMIRFRDRHGKDFVLSPSHEEAMVDLVKESLHSYRDFPIFLFQFQTKFRDEERVRGGLTRTKEFVMKDAYSFHRSYTDLNNFFPKVFAAYERIFTECGLNVIPAEAGVGFMGGEKAYEFFLPSHSGDDVLIQCPECGYSANRDVAKGAKNYSLSNPQPMVEVETPDCKTMENLSSFLNVPKSLLTKSMVYKTLNGFVMAVVRGDYEVSREKLSTVVKSPVVRLASQVELELKGLVPGYLSPIGKEDVMPVVIDEAVSNSSNLVLGGNSDGLHYLNANFGRDFESPFVGDIVQIKENNLCLLCGGALSETKAIELGNIFKLDDFYSRSLNLSFNAENGEKIYPNMGSYGIGIGRLLSAIAEIHHDKKGLCWPKSVAPFTIFLMGIGKSHKVKRIVEDIYDKLQVETLIDDRMESPGVKFKDADLLGIPFRIVVTTRLMEDNKVEVYERGSGKAVHYPLGDIIYSSANLPWNKKNRSEDG